MQSHTKQDPVMNDSNDHIFNHEPGKKFAVVGSNRSQSEYLVKLINQFGNRGGFAAIR